MSKIVIYGGQGYIGKNIIRELFFGNKFYNISPSKRKKFEELAYTHICGNLGDAISFIKDVAPDYLIVAFYGNPKCTDTILYERIRKSIKKINLISKNKITFIFLSTQLVYEENEYDKQLEYDEVRPSSFYAKQCKYMEDVLIENVKNYHIIRVPILFGNLDDVNGYRNVIATLINQAKNKKDLVLYGDGNQKRTVLHIGNLMRIIDQIIKGEIKERITNASLGEFLSIRDIANIVASKFKVSIIENEEFPESTNDNGKSILLKSNFLKDFSVKGDKFIDYVGGLFP